MKELTKGPVLKLLLYFSLPILLGNILQQFYNFGDTMIVGQTLGIDDLAAIGATSSIVEMMFSLVNGFTVGFSILTGIAFGAKNEERLKQVIAKGIIVSTILTLILTIVLLLGIRPALLALHTPEDIIDKSLSYVRVIIYGIIITMAYNLIANTLRALGDSVFPLIALAISSILNLLFDLFFIKVLHMGIMGAGIATLLAQVISVVVCLIYIVKKCPLVHVKKEHFTAKGVSLSELIASGAGMALMYSIVSVGSIILQSGINSLGTDTIAAHVAARKIASLCMMPFATMSASLVTFTSQNLGAGKPERIKEGLIKSLGLAFAWGLIAMLAIRIFGKQLVSLITTDSNAYVLSTAMRYLKINVNLPFYCFLAVLCFFRSSLQGLGQKIIPIIGSLTEMIGKAVFVFLFVPKMGYMAVCLCEPVLWIVCSFIVIFPMTKFFRQTKGGNLEF